MTDKLEPIASFIFSMTILTASFVAMVTLFEFHVIAGLMYIAALIWTGYKEFNKRD